MASLDAIEAAYDQLEQCSFDALSADELMAVLARREVVAWRAPVVDHQILARLVAEADPGALGACSLAKALAERLRISVGVARRRLGEATDLGPRTALTGEPLEPLLPELAGAQAAGRIGPEHVAIARKAHAKIPAAVSTPDREHAERDLAVLASQFGPETFGRLADHLVAVLDPDGDFSDHERLTRRGLRLGRQGVDGMSTLSGKITPELRATLEPILAKLGAPGMCNPADEQPCVNGSPTEEQLRNDGRTRDQRNHDALLAASRAVLACGDLGQLNGLPVTVIVTTTLAELTAAAGQAPGFEQSSAARITGKALTAGGTVLPINPFHFIEAVIDYHRSTSPADTPEPDVDEQPPPDSDDWPWPDDPLLDDPVPGDAEYDAALQGLQDSYDAMDLDELVRRHFPADDDPLAA